MRQPAPGPGRGGWALRAGAKGRRRAEGRGRKVRVSRCSDLGRRDKPQSLTAANAQNAPNVCCPLRSHPTREEAGKHGPYPTKSSQQT